MKPEPSSDSVIAFVLLIDQVDSRHEEDRVPALVEQLDQRLGRALVLPFERTAGDEVQGLCTLPGAVVRVLTEAARLGGWRVGIGLGEVEAPLPASTRAARGTAYLAAREAIGQAHRSPAGVRLVAAEPADHDSVGAARYREAVEMAEAGLWLLQQLLVRRTTQGWQIVDMLDDGLSSAEAAAELGISPSAVSQRVARAHRVEVARGAELCAKLLHRAAQLAYEVLP